MEGKIKAVIDTSVYIAALGSRSKTSAPAKVMENLREGYFIAVISPQILAELIEVCERRGKLKEDVITFLKSVKDNILKILGDYSVSTLDVIDSKDNILLAAALEAKADYLVSLDKQHVQPLKHYMGTQIIDPNQFIHEIDLYKKGERKEIQTIIF
jgi:uncharacterized protein